jgi:hypothetical protein
MPRLTLSAQQARRLGCQLHAPAELYPQNDLLVLISVRGEAETRAMVLLKRLGKLKK